MAGAEPYPELGDSGMERYVAVLSPFGKIYDIMDDVPSYTVSDIDRFCLSKHRLELGESLQDEVQQMMDNGILERVDGIETTQAYGPAYRPKDEEVTADALLSWRAIKKYYRGVPDWFLSDPHRGLEALEGELTFF